MTFAEFLNLSIAIGFVVFIFLAVIVFTLYLFSEADDE